MKKYLAFLLIFMMISGFLISCDTNDTIDESSNKSSEPHVSSQTSENSDVTPDVYGSEIPVKDFEKRVFRVLSNQCGMGAPAGDPVFNGEIIQMENFDETTAGIVDIAKYETRKLIEERYNCSIIGDISGSYQQRIKDTVHGDLEEGYDIYFTGWGNSRLLISEGYLMDINSIRTIDTANPWWDQGSVKDMSINHKLYWLTGDINTFDNDGTWVVLFNKGLFNKYHQNVDIYSIVENGDWTLDKLMELAEIATYDSNDDDKMDEFDNWGFATEAYSIFFHVISSGQKLAIKDSEDMPLLNYLSDSVISTVLPVLNYYLDENKVIVANSEKYLAKNYPNVWEATTIKAFSENRAMFFCNALFNLAGFRELEFDYGILPMPKATSAQDSYYHTGSAGNMSAMSIPSRYKNIEDYDDLGILIEALGAESKNNVTPIYYEKNLKGRDANSLEDEKMLDIIFNTRAYDLVSPFNWGEIITHLVKLNDTNLVSRFQSIESKAQTELEDFIALLKD